MNNKFRLLSTVAVALACSAAHAITVSSVQVSTGLFTSKSGVCTIDFNTPASLTSCTNATYSANTPAHVVSGNLANEYVAPDATPYLTVGGSLADPVTISLTTGANYFGFYAGSIDSYNSITFTAQGGSAVTLDGNQINQFLAGSNANGSQSGYFNVFTDSLFTSITLSSSQAAFETDNHAFGTVPEPGSVALLGVGLLAIVAGKRRRAR